MKRKIVCMIGIVLVSALLFGCGVVNTVSDDVIITMPNGEKHVVNDEDTQRLYLDVFENKQELVNKPGYLEDKNTYIVEYNENGQHGTFTIAIQPSLLEVAIEFNREITTEDVTYIVDKVLSVTELKLEDLVFSDAFGLPLDADFVGQGSYKMIRFEYSQDGPWTIANTNTPTPSGFAFATSLTEPDVERKLINHLETSCDVIKKIEYKNYNYIRDPKGVIHHLYKGFVMDDESNWYRISDSDIQFLINQDEIYDSLWKGQ